jgi:hypothetical protein
MSCAVLRKISCCGLPVQFRLYGIAMCFAVSWAEKKSLLKRFLKINFLASKLLWILPKFRKFLSNFQFTLFFSPKSMCRHSAKSSSPPPHLFKISGDGQTHDVACFDWWNLKSSSYINMLMKALHKTITIIQEYYLEFFLLLLFWSPWLYLEFNPLVQVVSGCWKLFSLFVLFWVRVNPKP